MTSATAHTADEKRINVAIAKPLHRQAKAAAALSGRTLQEFVEQSIQAAIPNPMGISQQDGKKGSSLPVNDRA